MKWKRISSHQLRHPLLAVVVGGAISAFLAPYIAEHLQNYQKELEVKTDLVSRMSEATLQWSHQHSCLDFPTIYI
jgi:hypothetical protein